MKSDFKVDLTQVWQSHKNPKIDHGQHEKSWDLRKFKALIKNRKKRSQLAMKKLKQKNLPRISANPIHVKMCIGWVSLHAIIKWIVLPKNK